MITIKMYIMRKIFDWLFNRWTKWELIASDLHYTKTTSNPMIGYYNKCSVLVDRMMRTNKFNGKIEYKLIEK